MIKYRRAMKKGVKIISLILSVILLIVIAAVVVSVIINIRDLSAANVINTITSVWKKSDKTESFYYEGQDVKILDDGLAIVSVNGIEVLDENGEESLISSFTMERPAIESNGTQAVAYDIGGNVAKTFNKSAILNTIDTDGEIISASMNAAGWLAVSTRENLYTTSVTVYNDKGLGAYKWYSGQGYILTAEISDDNKNLAVLVAGEKGSDVVFFRLNSEEEQHRFTLSGEMMFDMHYLSDGSAAALTENSLIIIDKNGEESGRYDFSDKYLDTYCFGDDDNTVISLSDSKVGSSGSISVIDTKGDVSGTAEKKGKVRALSALGNYLAVLGDDSVAIYGKSMEETGSFGVEAGSKSVILRADGSAVVAGEYQATVYRYK